VKVATTIPHVLHENGRACPDAPAYYVKDNGVWQPTRWGRHLAEVRQAARALIALGVEPGGRVAILGFNRPEWVVFDLAAMLVGAAPAGIYTTSSAAEIQHILAHTEASVLLVEGEEQGAKLRQVGGAPSRLRAVVRMRGAADEDPEALGWDAFLAAGEAVGEDAVDRRLDGLRMDGLATLIYTSGTTGPPKGVMLSHANLSWMAESMRETLGLLPSDSLLSYLPLSHIAEQLTTIHGAIAARYAVYFAETPAKVAENLREVQPTLVFGVPRVWERFHEGVRARLQAATGAKAAIAAWAQRVGRRVAAAANEQRQPGWPLAAQHRLASRLFFGRVKPALGLGRARFCACGAAPIDREILEFFSGLDIVIYEIYGSSESSGPTTCNRPGVNRFGTVGQVWPGLEVRLAADGEILVKGPGVFTGYYRDAAATAEALVDGWYHSGDLGELGGDGYLRIIGRKKEILITTGGKNITPDNIELALRKLELVAQAVAIGEGRNYVSALLTLDQEAAAAFAREHGLAGEALDRHPLVLAEIEGRITREVNPQLARVAQVRKFRVLARDLTVEAGELTPTLKLKRRVIDDHFAAEIESMYSGR